MVAAAEPGARYAAGARVLVRDEEWLVRRVTLTDHDGYLLRVVGASEFVQDEEAVFLDGLEHIEVLRPEGTKLVRDTTPTFRRSRLYLEAVLRRTPLPRTEKGLALAEGFLLDSHDYQQRPAEKALAGLRPRILIGDVVGLGKTLEIGLILAELVRRGRGDRILVVTPQHVLEQFQHELWTRFALPLVRLDSLGIQRIQQEIPAGRNPFTYFKRVIVSIDTLKDVGMYEHHLRNTTWDAVVIDESHNLIGETSLRNRLAKLLAVRTDALVLASATPHNGDKQSFAELVRLLEPTAVTDIKDYTRDEIDPYYIRRTKADREVTDKIADEWAPRAPSISCRCPATPAEEKVFAELAAVWLPASGEPDPAVVGKERRLFPYTLVKAFLSSHLALIETVDNRLASKSCTSPAERAALERLRELAGAIPANPGGPGAGADTAPAKLTRLLRELREIGAGPASNTRVVVFSERIRTLRWLSVVVPAALGFSAKATETAVKVLHGGLTDTAQQEIVEQFSLGGNPLRLLFTGDIASEGVNLHRECHHLVHYDLPWSLIRIEQRNGRIDRYGQKHEPQFRAIVLTSAVDGAKDDTAVAEKLLRREDEAHRTLGTAEAVTGEFRAELEEQRMVRNLVAGRPVEEALVPRTAASVMANLLSGSGPQVAPPPARAKLPTLFGATEQFVDEALREVFADDPETALALRREPGLLSFDAPEDLEHRLSDLPRSYLADQRSADGVLRLRLTFDRDFADAKLTEARRRTRTSWPDVGFVSEIHPVVDWLVDKVLVRLGRQQAPVLVAEVTEPVFLVQGIYCNRVGQPTVVRWMAVSGLPDEPRVEEMEQVLKEAGVGPAMTNPPTEIDLDGLQRLVPAAVAAAARELKRQRMHWDASIAAPLEAYRAMLRTWRQRSLLDEDDTRSATILLPAAGRSRRKKDVEDTVVEQIKIVDRLETSGEPLLRVLAVLEPGR
ncbi:helicase [Frankia sp. B2]|uniref:DEAD/DEAH box helicase n=1 Tax=unclassified Frankia TaxID=2632575 RepID=UPI0005B83596|nr:MULTISPECIES: DEAD/DEAH box helicase [unclassified Frankia]TFE29139.1 helicase [Frankia sp. B2]